MKLKDLLNVMDGSARYSISDTEKPMCYHDFWKAYRMKPEWEMEVVNVKLIPRSKDDSGLWYDDVICLIKLN